MSDGVLRSATISADGLYRYELLRRWDVTKPRVTWLMLNPSTADAAKDDATIRACMAFARRWDHGGIAVVNLFAYRATRPAALLEVDDPIGPGNKAIVDRHIAEASLLVAAWGATVEPLKRRGLQMPVYLVDEDTPLHCLGVTHGGQPRHPCRLAHATPLLRWPVLADDEPRS